jgi:FtsH-binding integral membrane protein
VDRASGNKVEVTADKRWRRGDPDDVRIEVRKVGNDDVLICALWNERTECDEDGYRPRGDGRRERGRENDTSVQFTVLLPAGVNSRPAVNGGLSISGAWRVDASSVNGSVEASTGGQSARHGQRRHHGAHARGWTRDARVRDREQVRRLWVPEDVGAEVDMRTVNGRVSSTSHDAGSRINPGASAPRSVEARAAVLDGQQQHQLRKAPSIAERSRAGHGATGDGSVDEPQDAVNAPGEHGQDTARRVPAMEGRRPAPFPQGFLTGGPAGIFRCPYGAAMGASIRPLPGLVVRTGTERATLVRRTYTLVFASVLVTMVGVAFGLSQPRLMESVARHPFITMLCTFAPLVLALKFRDAFPANLGLVFLFTFVRAGHLASDVPQPDQLGIIGRQESHGHRSVCSRSTWSSKRDFGAWGSFFTIGLVVLIVTSLLNLFFRSGRRPLALRRSGAGVRGLLVLTLAAAQRVRAGRLRAGCRGDLPDLL